MKSIRTAVVYIANLGCIAAITILIWPLVFQATVFNPNVMRSWFSDQRVYKHLAPDLLRIQSPKDKHGNELLSPAFVKQTFAQAFSSTYLEQQTEEVWDGIFSWFTGREVPITFFSALNDTESNFTSRLAVKLEPFIGTLPVCSTNEQVRFDQLSCKPNGWSMLEFSKEVVNYSLGNLQPSSNTLSPTFQQVVSQELLHTSMSFDDLDYYPPVLSGFFLWSLVTLVICLSAIFLISDNRPSAFYQLGRWLCFDSLLVLMIALTFFYIANDPSKFKTFQVSIVTSEMTPLLLPFIQQIAQSIGLGVSLLGGVVGLTGLALWRGLRPFDKKTVT